MSRAFVLLVGLLLAAPVARAADASALWKESVQGILDANCVKCHGPLKQKSGLDLDTVESVLKGGEDGAVVKPGKPEESPLMAALIAEADPHMPPKKQLAAADIAKVRSWITALAEAPLEAKRVAVEPPPPDLAPPAAIDYFLAAGWRERGVEPTAACDDLTLVRRLYLDLSGRIPKTEEVESFVADSSPSKREALVDRLLAGDEYPRNFREIWDVLLMGRSARGREQRRRDSGWFTFLETAFKQNRPWNEVVHAIIVGRPEKPVDRGALWFLYERKDDYQQIAEALAPVIYGTRVGCAQCHDHPLAREIKQGHYWGLVAAFNRGKNLEKGGPAVTESAVGGFVNFTNLRKESQPATLTLLNGRTVEEAWPAGDAKQDDKPEGYLDPAAKVKIPKVSRRAAVADAVTQDNPLLARSFVNHTWAILMGRGIVHPVDEMNSKHPPSHPELLEWLARDFAEHGYDTHRLVRSIVLSRGYQLAGASHEAPPPEAFAAAAERPLTAETLARSVQVATGQAEEDQTLRRSFLDAFPEVLPRVQRATIQQAMLLANNESLAGLFQPATCPVAAHLVEQPDLADRVRVAFQTALIRQPDAEELAGGIAYLQARSGQPAEAAGQLLWALVTGPEFLTNH